MAEARVVAVEAGSAVVGTALTPTAIWTTDSAGTVGVALEDASVVDASRVGIAGSARVSSCAGTSQASGHAALGSLCNAELGRTGDIALALTAVADLVVGHATWTA